MKRGGYVTPRKTRGTAADGAGGESTPILQPPLRVELSAVLQASFRPIFAVMPPRPALDILQPSSSPRVVFTAAVQPLPARATNFVNFRAGTMSLWFIAGEETAR